MAPLQNWPYCRVSYYYSFRFTYCFCIKVIFHGLAFQRIRIFSFPDLAAPIDLDLQPWQRQPFPFMQDRPSSVAATMAHLKGHYRLVIIKHFLSKTFLQKKRLNLQILLLIHQIGYLTIRVALKSDWLLEIEWLLNQMLL